MKTAAIIAEYNPFHNGHAYHLQKTRECGCTHTLAIMSGDFVQRGSPAIADKYLRAKAAVKGGVDLVLELPLPWCISAAQDFAYGGVQIADAVGAVDVLSFGCEDNDLARIQKALQIMTKPEIQNAIRINLQKGYSYPKSVSLSLFDAGEIEIAALLSTPNNVLAFEYCKNLAKTKINPLLIQRYGCKHDGESLQEGFASASEIRENIYKLYNVNLELYDLYKILPEAVSDVYTKAYQDKLFPLCEDKFNIASLSRLRMLSKDVFAKLPFVADGLESRLYQAVQTSASFNAACDFAKNKQITHARIRRTLLQAALGLQHHPDFKKIPYIKVLAMNDKGMQILKRMRDTATLPIIMRHSDAKNLDSYAKAVYDFNQQAADFYFLCLPDSLPCGMDAKSNVYIEINKRRLL